MTSPRRRVVLWDIDGTLVSAGGAGRRAFERAVADFVGPFDGALRDMRLDGMTDRLIVREALGVTGIALTKLDGTAKGGVVIGICDELRLPVRYVGVGETVGDLKAFVPREFVEALFA